MKKIIAFSFLLISITVYGQDDQRKKDSIGALKPLYHEYIECLIPAVTPGSGRVRSERLFNRI